MLYRLQVNHNISTLSFTLLENYLHQRTQYATVERPLTQSLWQMGSERFSTGSSAFPFIYIGHISFRSRSQVSTSMLRWRHPRLFPSQTWRHTAQIGFLWCCIDEIHEWLIKNKLRLNPYKKELIYCSSARRIGTLLLAVSPSGQQTMRDN